MRRYRNNPPRQITARFDSTCAETGKPIKKGDSFIYWGGKAYSQESKQADEYRALEFASTFNMGDAGY